MNIYLILFGAQIDIKGQIIAKLKSHAIDGQILCLSQNVVLLATKEGSNNLLKEIKKDLKDNTVYFFLLPSTALLTHNCPDDIKQAIAKTLHDQIEFVVIENEA
jgi:hypothetical protein